MCFPILSMLLWQKLKARLFDSRYFKGEPFPRPKTQPVRVVPEEDELCDLELERLRNIERNKELLRQLGLT